MKVIETVFDKFKLKNTDRKMADRKIFSACHLPNEPFIFLSPIFLSKNSASTATPRFKTQPLNSCEFVRGQQQRTQAQSTQARLEG
jgi:hypothetical protein